ncbi:MAG: murein L,D-transpeptidase catalytic domain family protein [Chitinophagaceae bacterium]|nr:murein L,D-transpeptidase catalytic domain family protein [Chitinophagaceae bacterium]
MKRLVPLSVYGLAYAWLSLSWVPVDKTGTPALHNKEISVETSIDENAAFIESVTVAYNSMQLQAKGLSIEAFTYAMQGYEQLKSTGKVSNEYLTICDFSQSARKKRMYIIDVENEELVIQTHVAHGRNSGGEYARKFSNQPESHQSSLGFYVTKNTYFGEHGLSLRVEGVEKGINDKAYRRAIVIHGATYIGEGHMGRSYGCPAVPQHESKKIIQTIKNGSCMFIYHPDKRYLTTSKILND